MKVMYIVAAIVLIVVAGVGGFYGGTVYAQSQSQNSTSAFLRQRGAGQNGSGANSGQRGGQANSQFGQFLARGQIKSVNGNTIQISTAQSVVTVTVDNQTVVSKTDAGSLSDLKPGDRVTVFSHDSGSSPVASAIQLQGPVGQ